MDDIKKRRIESKLRDMIVINKLNEMEKKETTQDRNASQVIRRRKGCPDKWVV
ncbi:MAG: hypothetical protein HQK77_02530 [Desulfobacterales bacterium]|nr:hypothetical protein [Desulfobacterales bacterium]